MTGNEARELPDYIDLRHPKDSHADEWNAMSPEAQRAYLLMVSESYSDRCLQHDRKASDPKLRRLGARREFKQRETYRKLAKDARAISDLFYKWAQEV